MMANQQLDSMAEFIKNTTSLKSLLWRLEAHLTRRTLPEIILKHTLLYEVDRVLLIHKKSGLLLQHVARDSRTAQDPDLVLKLLTAVNDFLQNNICRESGETIGDLHIGNLSVWIEQSAQAVLASIIRGTPSPVYRELIKDVLRTIEREQGADFEKFQGDTTFFVKSSKHLKDCLKVQFKSQ